MGPDWAGRSDPGSRGEGAGSCAEVHVGAGAAVWYGVVMAELQQHRVQEAVDTMMKSLEKENIRKMQVARLGSAHNDPRLFPKAPRSALYRRPSLSDLWGRRTPCPRTGFLELRLSG